MGLSRLRAVGLDVYVGSLTRYYTGEWETIVQQAGREAGLEVEIRTPDPPEDAITDPEEIGRAVEAWRNGLSEALGKELHWNESPEAPYYTDKPAWDGYGSLQVLAAYEERGKGKLPRQAVTEWEHDKQWRKVAAGGWLPRYGHLYAPQLWLPVELDGPFQSVDAGGNELAIGSSVGLVSQLRELNERTYRGTADELSRWRHKGAEADGPFDDSARFGLAVFLELAEKSVSDRLPMRLDY